MSYFSDNCHDLVSICGRSRRHASGWKDRHCQSRCHDFRRSSMRSCFSPRGIFCSAVAICYHDYYSLISWRRLHLAVRIWHWRKCLRLCQICTNSLIWLCRSRNGASSKSNCHESEWFWLVSACCIDWYEWLLRPKWWSCHEFFEMVSEHPVPTCT